MSANEELFKVHQGSIEYLRSIMSVVEVNLSCGLVDLVCVDLRAPRSLACFGKRTVGLWRGVTRLEW